MVDSVTTILDDSADLFARKEEDYGESWRLTGKILSLIIKQQDEDEITIPAEEEYLTALGLYTRRLDKLVRSFNGTFMKEKFEVDESVEETVQDQVPYSAMHTRVVQELQENDEKEDYEYCSQCGEVASKRLELENPADCRYEYYCECSYVWMGN